MHELAMAESLLRLVEQEAARHPGTRVVRVGLRVGEWSGVEPEALAFCFEVLTRDSPLGPLELAMEMVAPRRSCSACGAESANGSACARCGATARTTTGGDELELAYLEVEDR